MENKTALRMAVKAYYDYQAFQIGMDNRLKIKKDGTDQVIPDAQKDTWNLSPREIEVFKEFSANASEQEEKLMKIIKQELKEQRIWTEWLEGVKGCGPLMAAVIITQFNIERATTVSKMWQFAGLNPGKVKGKKVIDTKKDMSEYKVTKVYTDMKGKEKAIIETDELVRGDKKAEGFVAPFNGFLRSKLIGVLAGSFIKSKSPYSEFYYNYKTRLEQEDGWKDEAKGHRHNAALRYMIKIFLKDLYVQWRAIEGLPVRPSYQEEYLSHEHTA